MKFSTLPRTLFSNLRFIVLTAALWGSFFLVVDCHRQLEPLGCVLFALGAGGVTFLMLRTFGYFHPLRVRQRKSDLLLMLCAVPLGGALAQGITQAVVGVSLCSHYSMIAWSPLLALLIFGTDYLLASWVVAKRGRRRRIALYLQPHEYALFLEDLVSVEMDKHVRLLPAEELLRYLDEGREQEIDLVVISRQIVKRFETDVALLQAHLAGIPIVDYHRISADLTGRVSLRDPDLWSYVLSATPQTSLLRAYSRFKVMAEPVFAACLILVFSPLVALVALAIKLSSTGSVFYYQRRRGFLGRPFTLVKFRSMYENAEEGGPQWSQEDDQRITPLGRILRKTRLDELPQLWNVLEGEMSFFGPRPERPELSDRLTQEIPLFPLRTLLRPGITGWAQVCAGYAASTEESRLKLEYDLYYLQHMSPRLDLIILLKTVLVALLGNRNASKNFQMGDPELLDASFQSSLG